VIALAFHGLAWEAAEVLRECLDAAGVDTRVRSHDRSDIATNQANAGMGREPSAGRRRQRAVNSDGKPGS